MIKVNDKIVGEINLTGFGNATVIDSSGNTAYPIHIKAVKTNKALHLDKVLVNITNVNGNRINGEVIEIVDRFKTEFVGKLEVSDKFAFFIPDNKKNNVDFFIPLTELKGGKDGDKVIVRLKSWGKNKKNPNGVVIKVLGKSGDNDVEIHSILEDYNLPYEFPKKVMREVDLISTDISDDEIDRRLDMRDVLTFTIDGETARDLDDALSVQWINGNIEVGVHIADVSYYVKPNSKVDEEAYKRGTSVYLVDRVVPMLPEKLSNHLCSLNPNTDKLVYSFIFTLDKDGKVINERFNRGVINTNYRLTYNEVQKVIEGGELDDNELKKAILDLNRYAIKLRKKRSIKNSLQFSGSEVRFKFDDSGYPTDVYFLEQKEANWLIEEFMVLTNRRVCEYITKKDVPMIHRTHDSPDLLKLESLKTFVESIGYILDINDKDNIKKNLNGLIFQAKDTPEENIINNLVIRCMSKANYQTINVGHYGLGVEYYMHTTSPIRRYPDLIFHRIISSVLKYNGYLK